MRILMLSGDPLILCHGSDARVRMEQYAGLFTELHIVVTIRIPAADDSRGNLFLYAACGRRGTQLWRMYRRARLLCRKIRFDVVSAQGADEFGLIGFFLARRFRVPLQVQIHTDILSPWYRRASWKECVRYWLAQFLIPRADCIRVVSERIRRSILSRLNPTSDAIEVQPPQISVIPIFTDPTPFFNAKPDPITEARFRDYHFKMVAVGRFVDKEKNFHMLIKMMRDFVKICPKALLVLVGDGQDRRNYELGIRNYGLEKNVILEGWRNDLPAFYKSFDLYLMSSNYEGWGRTVIEAMASGLPVVTTDVGLAGEVVKSGKNGVVIPVADREAVRGVVTDLYNDPPLRAKLSEAGLATIKSLEPKNEEEYLQKYAASYCNPKS